jgi:hypothetical protein
VSAPSVTYHGLRVPLCDTPWTGGGGRTVLRAQVAAAARRALAENNQLSGTLPTELGALTLMFLL